MISHWQVYEERRKTKCIDTNVEIFRERDIKKKSSSPEGKPDRMNDINPPTGLDP